MSAARLPVIPRFGSPTSRQLDGAGHHLEQRAVVPMLDPIWAVAHCA
jgi:hypothetical protein